MKTIILFLLVSFSIQIAAQNPPGTYLNKSGEVHLLGTINRSDFQREPFQEWHQKIYNDYTLDESTIKVLNKNYDKNLDIKIYLGTWCGDSKLEVTRFLKMVDQSKIDMSNIELICLDSRSEFYKQGPDHEEKGLNIHRVPTFIFYDDGEEVARIVEHPVTSIEKDVAQIYAGIAPTPNYFNANYLSEYLADHSIEEADSMIVKHARFFKRKTVGEAEMNTLGYVFIAAKEVEKAIIAFKLNTLLFPESGNAFDSLAEGYKTSGNTDLAIEHYMFSFVLDPENGNAVEMIKEMAGVKSTVMNN